MDSRRQVRRSWKKLKPFTTPAIATYTTDASEQALTKPSALFTTSEYFETDRVVRANTLCLLQTKIADVSFWTYYQ